jgi:hypothetical protein
MLKILYLNLLFYMLIPYYEKDCAGLYEKFFVSERLLQLPHNQIQHGGWDKV